MLIILLTTDKDSVYTSLRFSKLTPLQNESLPLYLGVAGYGMGTQMASHSSVIQGILNFGIVKFFEKYTLKSNEVKIEIKNQTWQAALTKVLSDLSRSLELFDNKAINYQDKIVKKISTPKGGYRSIILYPDYKFLNKLTI